MLISPSPFPDEIADSYLGRLMRANGVASEKEMRALIVSSAGMTSELRSPVPLAVLLAWAASMEVSAFVRQHTMLPLRRGITSYQAALSHGCESNLVLIQRSAMRPARPGAYFCLQCVEEDEDFHGVSYWRREHQIPGLFWCPKHDAPLRYSEVRDAFHRSASIYINECEALSEQWLKASRTNELVGRFLTIASDLLGRTLPFEVRDVRLVLRTRAAALGYQVCPRKSRNGKLLSDAVVEKFGREWLATISPAVADKRVGELLHQLDGVLFMSKSASSTAVYLLALAVLFDSADDALNALISPGRICEKEHKGGERRRISSQDLKSAYLAARGDYGAIAKSLAVSFAAVSKRLEGVGLPNLRGRSPRTREAMAAFFLDDKSFNSTLMQAGITTNTLEDLLRICGAEFARCLRQMTAPSKSGSFRRPLQLTPREAEMAGERMATKFGKRNQSRRKRPVSLN
jgi:hypothetical protein